MPECTSFTLCPATESGSLEGREPGAVGGTGTCRRGVCSAAALLWRVRKPPAAASHVRDERRHKGDGRC